MKVKEHNEDSSSYREICIYDKELETQSRFKNGTVDRDEVEKYKNIIRVEVKVKNGKLNSNKSQDIKCNKDDVRSKNLEVYYNQQAFNNNYSKTIVKLFFTEPFFRIDIALQMIIANRNLKDKMKIKLCELLQLIHQLGYTEAKRRWTGMFCSSTFNSHIKRIRSLGINPLTYPTYINGKPVSYYSIPNFTLAENGIQEKFNEVKYF